MRVRVPVYAFATVAVVVICATVLGALGDAVPTWFETIALVMGSGAVGATVPGPGELVGSVGAAPLTQSPAGPAPSGVWLGTGTLTDPIRQDPATRPDANVSAAVPDQAAASSSSSASPASGATVPPLEAPRPGGAG